MRTVVELALVWCATARVFELILSRRNARRLRAAGAWTVARDGFVPIVTVQALWLLGILVEEIMCGPTYAVPRLQAAFGVLFAGAEGIRFWCMATLGWRWNVRVIVLDRTPPIRTGPYRFMKHPNYLGVVIGIAALPLALGLVFTAAIALPLKLLVLKRRICAEETALSQAAPPEE